MHKEERFDSHRAHGGTKEEKMRIRKEDLAQRRRGTEKRGKKFSHKAHKGTKEEKMRIRKEDLVQRRRGTEKRGKNFSHKSHKGTKKKEFIRTSTQRHGEENFARGSEKSKVFKIEKNTI